MTKLRNWKIVRSGATMTIRADMSPLPVKVTNVFLIAKEYDGKGGYPIVATTKDGTRYELEF